MPNEKPKNARKEIATKPAAKKKAANASLISIPNNKDFLSHTDMLNGEMVYGDVGAGKTLPEPENTKQRPKPKSRKRSPSPP